MTYWVCVSGLGHRIWTARQRFLLRVYIWAQAFLHTGFSQRQHQAPNSSHLLRLVLTHTGPGSAAVRHLVCVDRKWVPNFGTTPVLSFYSKKISECADEHVRYGGFLLKPLQEVLPCIGAYKAGPGGPHCLKNNPR